MGQGLGEWWSAYGHLYDSETGIVVPAPQYFTAHGYTAIMAVWNLEHKMKRNGLIVKEFIYDNWRNPTRDTIEHSDKFGDILDVRDTRLYHLHQHHPEPDEL